MSRLGQRRNYPWRRYWVDPRTDHVNPDEGFFPDPEDESIFRARIPAFDLRNLTSDPCLVLLGEPGLGKSHAIKDTVTALQSGSNGATARYVDLGAYDDPSLLRAQLFDHRVWRDWLPSDGILHLFLDSLDEALLHVRAVHKMIVAELSEVRDALPRLRLRVACRTAEWIPDFDVALADLWQEASGVPEHGVPRHLSLAPLRVIDAWLAAEAEDLEAEQFLSEIAERGWARFAALPLTLRMMLEAAVEEEGLPRSQADLFHRAALRLCSEHDTGRSRDPARSTLHPGQRLAVGQRIAAATLFAGRAAVATDPREHIGRDVHPSEIAGFHEEDPDSPGGAAFRVDVPEIEEVLRTALFAGAGPGRVTFVHRSLGEFLAAKYVVAHRMPEDQILPLITASGDPERRLIPQLREVAAWVANWNGAVRAELMTREPEVLLRVETVELPPEERARLVDALLNEESAERLDRWDRRVRRNLTTVCHPELASQLRPYIRESSAPLAVRQLAITLARVCEVSASQPDLLTLAFSEEPAYLRDDAVWALKEYGDIEARRSLVPLTTEPVADDVDDEIKGQALEATFGHVLNVEDVLPMITPARNESLLGAYRMFVRSTLPNALGPSELPAALDWSATFDRPPEATDLVSELSDLILIRAFGHVGDPLILERVVEVVAKRLRDRTDLLGPIHRDDSAFADADTRRKVLEALLPKIGDHDLRPTWLAYSIPTLLRTEDLGWLMDRLEQAIGGPDEQAWAGMIAVTFVPEDADLARVFDLYDASPEFRTRLAPWFEPVRLDSDTADMWRRPHRSRGSGAQVPDDAPDLDEVIDDELDRFEAGDITAWPRLNYAAIFDRRGQATGVTALEADLTKCPGWERADDTRKARIVEAALKYVQLGDSEPHEWFGTNQIWPPAFAGYRALYLLAGRRPATLEDLPAAAWAKWASIVVGYPRSSGVDDETLDDALVALTADRAPQALAEWATRKVEHEMATNEGRLFGLWRLRNIDEPTIVDAILDQLARTDLPPATLHDLLDYGLRHAPERAIDLAAQHVLPCDPETEVTRARRREAAVVLLSRAPQRAWPLVQSVLQSDPALGRDVIEGVAYAESVDVAAGLADRELAELVDWLYDHLPPGDDPPLEAGAHFVSPREQAGRMRDRLVAVLAERGTDASLSAIEGLRQRFPTEAPLRFVLRRARDARRAHWEAPAPGAIVRLAQDHDARIVLSADHLQAAVLAALGRIQHFLRDSQPPGAAELWNTGEKPAPKHEEELSDRLLRQLNRELTPGSRVLGRELLVRPSRTGRGRGQSVDLQVFAPAGQFVDDAEIVSVMIEAKGCWHGDLDTAALE